MAMGHNRGILVNTKMVGKWMVIPKKYDIKIYKALWTPRFFHGLKPGTQDFLSPNHSCRTKISTSLRSYDIPTIVLRYLLTFWRSNVLLLSLGLRFKQCWKPRHSMKYLKNGKEERDSEFVDCDNLIIPNYLGLYNHAYLPMINQQGA